MFIRNDAIDIWVVERQLGQGGMGSVYRCHNRDAKRILAAVKVLDYGLKRIPKARLRFVREAEILYSLNHPNIVKVRNVRLDSDPPYIEMEFVEGRSLERRLLDGPIPVPEFAAMLVQLLSALAYLHSRGVRHRDIKPSNLLLRNDGSIMLVDFGIATEEDGSTLSEVGQAIGSVSFVPPEWLRFEQLDAVKWDLYALGVVAYQALTCETIFGVPSGGMSTQRFLAVLQAKQNHPPLDPGPAFPLALRELIGALTQSDPDARLGSAEVALERLQAADLTMPERPDDPGLDAATLTAEPTGETMIPGDAQQTTNPPLPIDSPAQTPATRTWSGAGVAGPPPVRKGVVALGASAVLVVAWILLLQSGMLDGTAPAVVAAPAGPTPVADAPISAIHPPSPSALPPSGPQVRPAEPVPAVPAIVEAALKPRTESPRAKRPMETKVTPQTPGETPVSAGPPVRASQLAAWLSSHPEWQREAALSSGGGDDKFLAGWVGATPPAGMESRPVVAVSWSLANAYCQGHGGLADLAAAPTSWTESLAQPWMEYRQSGGKPRWRRDDGGSSDKVDPTQSGVFVGFRCAR